jgi:hypothetical protein
LVLYDKKSNFLGIGQNELFMLGYEDIEEFKSYHDDFADLFVNHPGYISKFKNFSWIDYTLHSGVSNKNVILRHKNGKEIEAKLNIIEIFLFDKINEADSIYNIDINISMPNSDFTTTINPHLKNENIKLEPILDEPEKNIIEKEEIKTQEEPEPKDDFSIVSDFSIEDYEDEVEKSIEPESYIEPISIKSEPEIEISEFIPQETEEKTEEKITITPEPTIRLKVDMPDDSADKENTYEVEVADESHEPEEDIKIKIQSDTSESTKKNQTNIEEVSNFAMQHIAQAPEDIDFTQITEDTGIDLEDLAMFMDEFLDELKKTSEILHSGKNEQSVKDKILQLKGIASSLKIKNFITILNLLFINYGSEKYTNYLVRYDNEIKNLESQLS